MPRLLLLLCAAISLGVSPGSGDADQAVPGVCRDALVADPSKPLAALAEAEQARWNRARKLRRQARQHIEGTVGMGTSLHSMAATAEVARLDEEHAALIREARVLCGCRQRRGDPYREDCDRLYRRWLPAAAPS